MERLDKIRNELLKKEKGMHKIIMTILLFSTPMIYSIILGPRLLNNSPLHYLLDIDKSIQEALVTRQIGKILYSKNYLESASPQASSEGSYTERPSDPAEGYDDSDGQWVWIPDTLESTNGTWYWILNNRCFYLTVMRPLI